MGLEKNLTVSIRHLNDEGVVSQHNTKVCISFKKLRKSMLLGIGGTSL